MIELVKSLSVEKDSKDFRCTSSTELSLSRGGDRLVEFVPLDCP